MRLLPVVNVKKIKNMTASIALCAMLTCGATNAMADYNKQDTLPLVMIDLQKVHATFEDTGLIDEGLEGELDIALDIRRDAIKEAALSFGARGGQSRRNYELMEQIDGYEDILDRVFDFRQLLIKAPSGLMIEPPIIGEASDALLITGGGMEAAVTDKIYNINKDSNIVTTSRNWREYLVQTWDKVDPPPAILWPKDGKEQADWTKWIRQGWDAGYRLADDTFEAQLNSLTADFTGMVRYRLLLAQDMITAPFALHEDRGVTTTGSEMRVGDRAVRITGPSQFQPGAEHWIPASH